MPKKKRTRVSSTRKPSDLHDAGEALSQWERTQREGKTPQECALTHADELALRIARVALAYLRHAKYFDEGEWARDPETAEALERAWRVMRGRDANDALSDRKKTKNRALVGVVDRTLEFMHLGWVANRDATMRELGELDVRFEAVDSEKVGMVFTRPRSRGKRSPRGPLYAIAAELFALIGEEIDVTAVRDSIPKSERAA